MGSEVRWNGGAWGRRGSSFCHEDGSVWGFPKREPGPEDFLGGGGSVSQDPREAAPQSLWPRLCSRHNIHLLVGSCVPPGEGWRVGVSIRSEAHGDGLLGAQSLKQRLPPHCWGVTVQPPGLVTPHVCGSLSAHTSQVVCGGNGGCSPPLPSLPACARGGGRGPAPRSPTLTPSGILGLMSCKMRRLQLTCTDGAHTRLQHPHTHTPIPRHCFPAPRRIFSRHWALLSLESTPLTSRPVPGRTEAANEPCVPTFSTQAPQVARLAGCSPRHLYHPPTPPPPAGSPKSTVFQAGAPGGLP